MLPFYTVTNKYQYDMILDDSQITDDTAVWYSIDFVIFSSCHSFYELWRPFFYSKCEKAHNKNECHSNIIVDKLPYSR